MHTSTLAAEQFADAIFDHFWDYLSKTDPEPTSMKPRLSSSRNIIQILHEDPVTQDPDPQIVEVTVGFMGVELLLPDYVKIITQIVRDSASQALFTMKWAGEEILHSYAFGEWLKHAGSHSTRQLQQAINSALATPWDPIAHNASFNDPWYGAIAYVTLQEKITAWVYQCAARIADRMGQPALARIFRRLARDESRHFAFYKGIGLLALSYMPEKTIQVYKQAAEEFAMPGKYGGIPNYDQWTKTGQQLGIVPDPFFAARGIRRLERGKVTLEELFSTEEDRIFCWNGYINAIRGIFDSMGIPAPASFQNAPIFPIRGSA